MAVDAKWVAEVYRDYEKKERSKKWSADDVRSAWSEEVGSDYYNSRTSEAGTGGISRTGLYVSPAMRLANIIAVTNAARNNQINAQRNALNEALSSRKITEDDIRNAFGDIDDIRRSVTAEYKNTYQNILKTDPSAAKQYINTPHNAVQDADTRQSSARQKIMAAGVDPKVAAEYYKNLDLATKDPSLMTEEDKQNIKNEYESLGQSNLFERYFGDNAIENKENYNRKQELDANYRAIKNEETRKDLISKGMTEEELSLLGGSPMYQSDIDELIKQGKTDEEIDAISQERFDKGEEARQKLLRIAQDSGESFDDYMSVLEDYSNEAIKRDALEHPAVNSAFTLATNPFDSAAGVGRNVINFITGKPMRNSNSYTDLTRNTVTQNIDNQFGRTVYGGAMSIGDMAVAAATAYATGGGSIVSSGIQALEKASQVMNEGTDRGLTPEQIFAEGALSGVTTYITEKIPMGKLENIAEKGLTSYNAKEIAKTLTAMFISEGAQEASEDIADWAMDSVVAWDNKEFRSDIQNYIDQGLTKGEAVKKVLADRGAQLLTDFVIGGIGGGAMGGAASGLARATGKINNNPSVQTDIVMNSPEALGILAEAGKNLDIQSLSRETQEDIEYAEKIEHAKEVANKPAEELTQEDVIDIANAINEQANSENNLADTINEINYRANVQNNLDQYSETGKIERRIDELPVEQIARENTERYIKSLRVEKSGVAPVQLVKTLSEAAEKFENETAAKVFQENYNGQNISFYTMASYQAYRAGETGQSFDTFMKNSTAANLMVQNGEVTESYLKTLFYNGQNARETETEDFVLRKNENRGLATGLKEGDQLSDLEKAVARKFGLEIANDQSETDFRGNFSAELARITLSDTADNKYSALVHEMFEFARAYDPEGMDVAEKALTNIIVSKSNEQKFVDAVTTYRDTYRKAGRKAPKGSSLSAEANKTFSGAQEEFINDAVSYIFSTEEGMNTFVNYVMDDGETTQEQKVSTLQTIKDWIDHLIQSIKNFISGNKNKQLGYEYAESLGLTSQELESISRMLTGVLDTARKNLEARTEGKGKESGEEKVSNSASVEVFRDSEDRNIYNFAEDAINKRINKDNKIVISDRISDKAGEDIYETIGVDAKGYKNTLIAERVQHIWDRHGVHGTADHSMANIHDIAQIEYVVDNYDGMTKGKGQFQFKNKDNTYADTVLLWKKMDDKYYYVVEAVPDTKKKTLYVVTAYKNNASPEVLMPNGLRRDARNELQSDAFISDSNIAESEEKSNTQDISEKKVFSLNVPVEETKDLIAVHNLSEDKLKGVLELGGFPMPSIAITKANMSHEGFGDISVLFRKDTIDPERDSSNKVYSGDAWTPTFPAVEYKVSNASLEKLAKRLETSASMLEANVYDGSSNPIDRLRYADYAKKSFLKEKGIAPMPTHRGTETIEAKPVYIKQAPHAEVYILTEDITYDKLIDDPDIAKEIASLIRKDAENRSDKARRVMNLKASAFETIVENVRRNPEFHKDDVNSLKREIGIIRGDIKESYEKDLGYTDGINEAVEANKEEYEKWLESLNEGMIEKQGIRNNVDPFTASGNRRSFEATHYEYTLDNIVRAMKEEADTGAGVVLSQFGNVKGVSVDKLSSIDEIKKERDRIRELSEEEADTLQKELIARFSEIIDAISPEGSWIDHDYAAENIADAVRKSKTKSGIKKYLAKYYSNIDDSIVSDILDLVSDIRNLSTRYLEAKPQRAVGFDEVAAVVVPSDDTDMIDLLNEKNIPVVEYTRGDKQSRVDAVNSVEDIRFSLSVPVDSEGNKLSEGQQAFFADSKVRDEQGRLMIMYHGTPNGTFTVFKGGSYFTNMAWYADRYQNQGASSLGYKKTADNPRTYEAYLNITKPFDTRDPKIKKIWDDQYYHKWDTGEITDSGLPDWTSAEGLLEFIEENELDFDGLIIDEGGIPGDDGEVISRGLAWVPINGREQVKSVDNLNPTENPDIRFSIDVTDPFFEAFEAIDEKVQLEEKEFLKLINERMDLDSEVSKKAISEVASKIKKQYNSSIKKENLARDLHTVFRYLKSTGNITMEDVMFVMKEIAKPILENVKPSDPVQEKLYNDFVNTVKTYKISLDQGQKAKVASAFNSYYDFQRMMKGKLNLSSDGIPLDNIWTELCDISGGALSYGTVPNDQPIELERYIRTLNPTYQMLEGKDMDTAATDLALEIYRQFFVYQSMNDAAAKVKGEISRRSAEMRDAYKKHYFEAMKQVETERNLNMQRLAKEIESLTAEEQEAIRTGDTVNQALLENMRKDYQDRYEKLEKQKNEQIAKAKAQYQNSWINKNLRRERSELKNRVLKEVKALQNIIAHPSEGATKHVPVNLLKPTIEMLEAINLDNGGRNKTIAERLKKMSEVYESFKNNDAYSFDYDERIASDIKELQEMFNNRSYADLEIRELERVIEIVQALKTQIKNANNLILQGRLKDAQEAADSAMRAVKDSRRLDNAAMNALNRYANVHLNAYREFRKLSGYKDSALMDIYNDLDEGSKREMQIQKDLGAIFQNILEGQKNQKEVKKFISTKDEDLVDIGITDKNGKPIKITRAMRMSLIMHSMNSGNMRHILGSGITVPNMYYFEKGKLDEAYAKGTNYRFVDYNEFLNALQRNDQNKIAELSKAAEKRIEDMKKELSDWEKDFLAAAEKMFHEETGKLINETSMKLKGYALARVKNYFPIKTDAHFNNQEWSGLVRDGSLEGMGMLKERVISTKPILLEDITNVIQRQIGSVSKYAGMAVPVRNFETIMKQTKRDQSNGQLHNLAEIIDTVWGSSDTKYLKNLMQDIQGGRSEKGNFLMHLRGQFAGATLTLNPSVAIKQAASYPTAAAVVGYKALGKAVADMRKGFITQKGLEELERINPLLWYRNQGNATQELADAKAVGFGKNLPLWAQKAINWTQWFDTGTVRTLEYAAKYYVDDHFNFEQGSPEYWEKVSEVFTNIVEQTQPNYSTLHKADIIRNPNSFVKMLVMFKTQPMQNFGIIYDAMGELNAAKISGNEKWIKEASSKAALAISSQAVSATVFSAMTILSQLLLHRWWKYRDDEGEWSWEKFWIALGEGALSCLTGAFIGGSEIYEALKHIFTGNTYYGIEVSTTEMINDFVENIGSLTKNAKALWDANTSEEREKATQKLLKSSINLGATVGEFKGTPVNNIKNMLSSMYFYATDIIRSIDEGELDISDDSNIAVWDIKTQYERIYEALWNEDTEKYNKLVQELIDKSMDESSEDLESGSITEEEISAKVEKTVTDKITNLMKADYLEGNISDEEMQNYLVEEKGKTEEEAYFQMKRWSTGATSDYGPVKDLISGAADDPSPENRNAVISEVEDLVKHGKDKDKILSALRSSFKDEYKELYEKGRAADLNSVLRAALVTAGYTDKEAKKKLESWLK